MTSLPMVQVALFARVGFGEPRASNGVPAYFRSHSRQNPQSAASLGKIKAETVYHGDHAFFRPRSRQNRRGVWGKSKRNPFFMAISQEKAAITSKPASGAGKFELETVYHGDRETQRGPISETVRIGETIWIGESIRIGEAANARPHSKFHLQNHLCSYLIFSNRTRDNSFAASWSRHAGIKHGSVSRKWRTTFVDELSESSRTWSPQDERLMRRALELAEAAVDWGETPIGAVIVDPSGRIIAEAFNLRETLEDPTAHAERIALALAGRSLGTWRLEGCVLYVTLEPCAMCAGAIVLSRIGRVVYGAVDPKAGACESLYRIPSDPRLNHRPIMERGLLAEDCGRLLRDFFRARRRARKSRSESDGPSEVGDPELG